MGELKRLEPGNQRKFLPVGQSSIQQAQTQLDKILASREFIRSEKLTRLLRHTCEHLFQPGSQPMKEYRLGVEVFGRDASYDPRLDPIVRVEAHRLRAKLKHYYQTEAEKILY